MKNLCYLLLFLPLRLAAQYDFVPSEQLQISVITCGPSQEELYTAFGHSAIRVFDPVNNFDAAFNYGVFDFDQPNFYLNFAKGFLYYRLGVYDYQQFQTHYIYDNRYVHEQVLNLTPEQKIKVFRYLQKNALPENQSYRYDYFYNNCATKIRDVIADALGKDQIAFDGSYIETNYSIRDLTDIYLKEQPWGDLGIDICLGLPMDKRASPYEYMFLPDYIESGFDHATIQIDGKAAPLVKQKRSIYESREMEQKSGLPHPLFLFGAIALAAVVLSVLDLKNSRLTNWFDGLLFGISGLIGFLLFFLWFFTDHNAAARNMNLLWAFPLHAVAAMALWKKASWLRNYFLSALLLSGLTLLAWTFLPQQLHYALVPMVIAMALRSFVQYRVRSLEQVPSRKITA
jgi:hypothetical protein